MRAPAGTLLNPPLAVIALFGNLSLLEISFIAGVAIMIFGRNLPRVAAQVYGHFTKARRALTAVWRESGIGDEIRQVQREMDQAANTLREADPEQMARNALWDAQEEIQDSGSEDYSGYECDSVIDQDGATDESTAAGYDADAQPTADPAETASDDSNVDEEPLSEPEGEASRRPPWYPTEDAFETPAD